MKEYIVTTCDEETINAFDALNAPEIIRCKDCKYGEPMCKPWDDIICIQSRATHIPDWYCADGKVRDDDG